MPTYKALAQNTYKFVHEVTLRSYGDIEAPTSASIGKAKMIVGGNLAYVAPYGTHYTGSSNTPAFTQLHGDGDVATSAAEAIGRCVKSEYILPRVRSGSTVVDGVVYHGMTNASYAFLWPSWATSVTGSCSSIPEIRIPPCTMQVIKATAEGVIVASQYPMNGQEYGAYNKSSTSASCYAHLYNSVYFCIPKSGGDLVLAINFEYPKYDVTLSGTGLQYSLDDGFTFADVTDGLELSQIEHVIFKNTGNDSVKIGTTSGGSDVGKVAAGETYVAVPTESGTWYIS